MNKYIDRFKKGFEEDASELASVINKDGSSKKYVDHVIYFIHGVENDGRSPQITKKYLEKFTSSCEVKPITYKSIFPWACSLQKRRQKQIENILLREKEHIEKANSNGSKISFICHSCGTQIFTEIIEELNIKNLKYVIFCGGIVNRNHNFGNIIKKGTNVKIINECGAKDIIPSIAASMTSINGFSSTGSLKGFGTTQDIIERSHNLGHSGYFKKKFIKKYWVPVFEKDDIPLNTKKLSKITPLLSKKIEQINLYATWIPIALISLIIITWYIFL